MSETLSVIAFASGLLGSVLGLVSLFYFLNDRIVRPRIIFKMCYNAGGGIYCTRYPFQESERIATAIGSGLPVFPGIEVINIGRASFVVDEVGVTRTRSLKNRHVLFEDLALPETKRPHKLNPGESVVLYTTQTSIFDLDRELGYAYASTSTEKTYYRPVKNYKHVMSRIERLRRVP